MNNLPKHHGAGLPETLGPMQLHRLHRLNPVSPASYKILARVCSAVTRHPIELGSYPNHQRIQQVFCLKLKKNGFSFRFGVRWGDRCKWGSFCFIWRPLPGPGPQPIGPLFWLTFGPLFWKLG